MIYFAWLREKTLKSRLYFYGIDLLANSTFLTITQFTSIQDTVHGFVIRLQNCIFLFPWITEISVGVEYYLDNNFLMTFNGFHRKLWNPDSTFTRTAIYIANGFSLTIAVFLSTRFSSRLCNFYPKWYFFISLNYWNLHWLRTLLRKQYLNHLAWFCKKTLKSGLYLYENFPPVKIISRSYRSFSSVQDSVHGFITQLRKGIFD